jgi:hypothetical protein
VARKKKKRAQVPAVPLKFSEGVPVRVKAGVTDPHYPDIPLGGWVGEIIDVDRSARPPLYQVEWSEATMESAPPIYHQRCERDDVEGEAAWMREDDLEPDTGGELVMEQPTELRPKPLDAHNPRHIVLGVFGLTSDDNLPLFTEENLARYHEHLAGRLVFPFPAAYMEDAPFRRPQPHLIMVRRLAPIERSNTIEGLFVEATREDKQNVTIPLGVIETLPPYPWRDEVDAYSEWFSARPEDVPATPSFGTIVQIFGMLCILMGMVVGAALEARPEAWLAIQIGAGVIGLIGAFIGATLESWFRMSNDMKPGKMGGLIFGGLFFAAIGATAGCTVLAYLGAIPGAIAGTIAAKFQAWLRWGRPRPFLTTLAGAVLGGMMETFYQDAAQAGIGAGYGALAGAIAGAVFFFSGNAYMIFCSTRREKK